MKKSVNQIRIALLFSCFVFLQFNFKAQQNTVLLIADDLGTDWCGFYENYVDTASLPNIRKLLARGIRFQNAMSNPVCSATRSGIFTGRYSFRTGVGNVVGGTGGSGQLDTAEKCIPKLLRQFNPNIPKAQVGKWHLQLPLTANLLNPNKMAYDYFAGEFNGAITDYYNWAKITNGVNNTCTNYATTETTNDGIKWVRTQTAKPFFMWMAFNAPHTPYHLPPAGFYNGPTLSGTTTDINNNPKKYFKADLEALDHEIGRLFDSLKVMNKFDSTNFIFIGDNGNNILSAQISNTNKAKGTIYQYGVHVPFIVSGPAVVNPGRVSGALVNTTDIFATVLELFGDMNWQTQIPANKPVDSKSLLPILKNQSSSVRPWSFCEIFKTTSDSSDGKAIRNTDYKLIRFNYGGEEFYNLSLDGSENLNLLNTAMTAADLSNYYYLCNELTNLVGTGNYCTAGVGVKEYNFVRSYAKAYPNPFSNLILVDKECLNDEFLLSDCLGSLVYSGTKISEQDFSHLEKGVYLLMNLSKGQRVAKLIKD